MTRLGARYCIGRVFSYTHARQRLPYLVPSLRQRIADLPAGAALEIDNPSAVRDIQDAEQIVDAILQLARRGATGTVNIGTGVGVSVGDIARAVARSLGRTITVAGSDRAAAGALVADTTRLRQLLAGNAAAQPMSSPQVSIVIPTFNRARLLPRAIDSSLAQTLPCEVVVCDHGSSDDTPAVAAAYGDRIRYIRRAQDRGPIVCWRDGIEQARGECVHLNYDDDWIEPDFVERTLPLLLRDVGFVYTRTRIHEPGNPATRVLLRHPAGIGPRARIVQFLLREKLPISPGCALFRRSDMLKNLLPEIPGAGGTYGRNSGVGEDLLLFLLATLDYPRYAHVPEAAGALPRASDQHHHRCRQQRPDGRAGRGLPRGEGLLPAAARKHRARVAAWPRASPRSRWQLGGHLRG